MSENKATVRLVVVGAGAMGLNHIRAIAQNERCDLVGIIDSDQARGRDAASKYSSNFFGSIEQAVNGNQIDGVVVAATTSAHFSICSELIAHRIPFLVEKPVTDDLSTTLLLAKQAEANSIPMMCGFVERFNPAIQTALSLMTEPLCHLVSVRHSPENPRATASVVHDLLIHDLDLALAFHNWNNDFHDIQSSNWTPNGGLTDEICDAIIKFGDGALASLSASRRGQRKIREIRVSTENHLLEIDLLRASVTIYRNVMQESVLTNGSINYRAQTIVDIPFVSHQGEPLSQQINHFRKMILGEVDFNHERATILASHELANYVLRPNIEKR